MTCTNAIWLFKLIKTDIKNINLKIIIGATINLSIESNIVQDLDNSPVSVEIPLARSTAADSIAWRGELAPLIFFFEAEYALGLD